MLDYDHLHAAISDLRKKQIFFIGGAAKSGTTWLQLLLNAHPQVSCNGEAHFSALASILWDGLNQHNQLIAQKNISIFSELEGYPRLEDDDFQYLLASWISLFLVRQSQHKSAVRAVGEKSPNNIRYFDVFQTLFPLAKFIHIVRDGRDCAVSGWFHNLRVTPDLTMKDHTSMDAYVLSFADSWMRDLATVQTFADRARGHIRQIRYEDLVANTERSLAGIFDFLNVEVAEALMAECQSEASFATLSGGRAAGKEDRTSFFRKGVVGDWQNHLSGDLDAAFRKRAGGWLERFGYA
jgi:Sulfotransferase family